MRKRILFLIPSLSIGGAERVLINLLKKIEYNKYDITICLFGYYGEYLTEVPKGVKVISIFNNSFLARVFTFLQRKLRISFLLKRIVLHKIKNEYDVGICFSDGLLTDVLLMLNNRLKKKITWVHSCYKSQKGLENVYKKEYNKKLVKNRYNILDNIVYVSKQSKLEFEQLFGDVSNRVIISNIFDSNSILEKSNVIVNDIVNDKKHVKLIAIGRLVEVKEFRKLIDAIHILISKKNNLELQIFGDGPLKSNLQSYINSKGLDNYIKLKGFVSNPYPYLKSSDIFILSSSSEALPTVLIEAMILNIPIVSTRNSGAIEISDNGKYALLSDHTAEDLSNKIEKMINSQKLRDYYAKNATNRVYDYDDSKILLQIDNLLNK